jgi:hypothetical protein
LSKSHIFLSLAFCLSYTRTRARARVHTNTHTHTRIYTPFKRKLRQEIISIPNLLAKALCKFYVIQSNEFRKENFTSFFCFCFLWRMEAIFSISVAWRINTSHTGEFLTGKRIFLIFSLCFQNDYAGVNIIAYIIALKMLLFFICPSST